MTTRRSRITTIRIALLIGWAVCILLWIGRFIFGYSGLWFSVPLIVCASVNLAVTFWKPRRAAAAASDTPAGDSKSD